MGESGRVSRPGTESRQVRLAEDGQTFRVSSDGTVSRQEGGRTFTISDDGLRDGVLEAARSGDTAGISGGASEWATPGVFDSPQDQTRQVVGPDGTSYRISAQGSVTTTDGSSTSQISDADLLDSVLEAGRGESANNGFTFVSEPAEVETAPQPGSTGVDSRLAVRVAEALNSETMSSFTKDGIIVSRDSNGYVSVRDASGAGSAIYRRDGTILKADIPGLAVSRQELQRAGMQSAPVGDPSQRTANAFNFGRVALADKDWFQQQFDDLPEELGARAARLDELAAIARSNTTKWPPNTSGWVLKDGDGKQVTPQQFFLDLADRIASSAEANRRELGRVESVNQAIQDYLAADQAAQSPLGQTGVSDLDEMGYYGFSGDFLEVEGDLAAVAGNYRKLAAEWSERPDNELVGIPVIRPAGDSATIDPADYFRQQANRYGWHLGKATDARQQDESKIEAFSSAVSAFKQDDERAASLADGDEGVSDLDEFDPDGPFRAHAMAEGDLAASIGEYKRLEQKYQDSPANQLKIPYRGGTMTPGEYFAIRRAELEQQFADVSNERVDLQRLATTPKGDLQLPAEDAIFEHQAEDARYWGIETPDGPGISASERLRELTPSQYGAHYAQNFRAREQAAAENLKQIDLIRGDLEQPLTVEDVNALRDRMAREFAVPSSTRRDHERTPAWDAIESRQRNFQLGEVVTVDSVTQANPDLGPDEVKDRVLYEAILDHSAKDFQDKTGVIELSNLLRNRGFNPIDAHKYAHKAVQEGWTSYVDAVATAGAIGGGYLGNLVVVPVVSRHAGRIVPGVVREPLSRLTGKTNPRLTTGVGRAALEESGEEFGEIAGDVIFTAATTGNPYGVLIDPSTYLYALGSIGFSSVAEADPGHRPRAAHDTFAADGSQGPVTQQQIAANQPFGNYDPTVIAQGNRMLDLQAMTMPQYHQTMNQPTPEGVDPTLWNARGRSMGRYLDRLQTDISSIRTKHPGMVVGYSGGGSSITESGLAVVDAPKIEVMNLGLTSEPAFLSPGDARFMVTSGNGRPDDVQTSPLLSALPPSHRPQGGPTPGTEGPGGGIDHPSAGDRGFARGSSELDGGSGVVVAGRGVDTVDPVAQVTPGGTARRITTLPLISPSYETGSGTLLETGRASVAARRRRPLPTHTQPEGEVPTGGKAPPGIGDPPRAELATRFHPRRLRLHPPPLHRRAGPRDRVYLRPLPSGSRLIPVRRSRPRPIPNPVRPPVQRPSRTSPSSRLPAHGRRLARHPGRPVVPPWPRIKRQVRPLAQRPLLNPHPNPPRSRSRLRASPTLPPRS